MTDFPVLLYSSPSPCGMVHFIFKVLDLDLDEGFTPRSTSNLENQVFSRLFESTGHSPFASLSAAEQWDYCRRRYQGLPEMIY